MEHIYTNNRPMTARVLQPGDKYASAGVVRKVPRNMMGATCEVCGLTILMPLRLGFDHAEMIRKHHLQGNHGLGLLIGTVTLDAL